MLPVCYVFLENIQNNKILSSARYHYVQVNGNSRDVERTIKKTSKTGKTDYI